MLVPSNNIGEEFCISETVNLEGVHFHKQEIISHLSQSLLSKECCNLCGSAN